MFNFHCQSQLLLKYKFILECHLLRMNTIFVCRPVFSHKYSIKRNHGNHEYKHVTNKPGIAKPLDFVKVPTRDVS